MTKHRTHCPSCRHRISPMVLECPICGLAMERRLLPRPLLYQASALQTKRSSEPAVAALSVPALGRVTPIEVPAPSLQISPITLPIFESEGTPSADSGQVSPSDSLWP